MSILLLSSTFPYPPSRGGTQIRTFNLLQGLRQQHPNWSLTLVTQREAGVTAADIESLGQWVDELKLFPAPQPPSRRFSRKLQRLGQFVLQGTPAHVLHRYDRQLQAWVDAGVRQHRWQVITAEHSVNEIYIRPQWQQQFPQLRTVLNAHSSLSRTLADQLAQGMTDRPGRDRLFLPLLQRYEQRMCRKFSQIVVTTPEDQQQFARFQSGRPIAIVTNGVDLDLFPYRERDPGGYGLVFAGGLDYFVNIDAAVRLAQEILPALATRYPQVHLTLVGSNPDPSVQALAQDPRVTVTGRVPSIADYLHRATVAVIPLRTGFGIKNKTLEALAAGVPVVASDRGLEGIPGVDDPAQPAALRANTVAESVAAIARLFEDADLRRQLAQRGRSIVEQHYSWSAASQRYGQLLGDRPPA